MSNFGKQSSQTNESSDSTREIWAFKIRFCKKHHTLVPSENGCSKFEENFVFEADGTNPTDLENEDGQPLE